MLRPAKVSEPVVDATVPAMPSLEQSRLSLLSAVGSTPQMVFVRPFGNIGDEMIWAGTRELLRDHIYREISVDELSSERGELAVLSGGGAWSRDYNEFMPEALAIAEARFKRVIVFPSTFDTSVQRVRDALARTRAVVFARERESYARIRGLCDARMAHDCAFFCPLPEAGVGTGTLNAFRDDAERLQGHILPAGNRDLSDTADSLDSWLSTIAASAEVQTDRAHVMIAAARMGKPVRYAPSSYFKVGAIAESCLADYDVAPAGTTEDMDAVVAAPAHQKVSVGFGELPLDADTLYAIELDERHELGGEALAALVDALDAEPDALVATPAFISSSRPAPYCGGWPVVSESLFRIETSGVGGETEPTGWAPLTGSLIRLSDEIVPSTDFDDRACRDADWALRLRALGPGRILRVPGAQLVEQPSAQPRPNDSLPGRAPRAAALVSHALMLERHGLLLPDRLLELMPELRDEHGNLDEVRARLLLAAVRANGYEWVLAEWMNGGLAPLLAPGEPLTPELKERLDWLEQRNEMLGGIESGGWWRLRERLAPARRFLRGR